MRIIMVVDNYYDVFVVDDFYAQDAGTTQNQWVAAAFDLV